MHPVFPVLCSDLGSITEGWDRARLAQRGGQGWASVTLRCSTLALSSIITQIHLGCSAGSGACEQLIPRSSSRSWVRSGNWSSFSADPPGFQAWLQGVKVPWKELVPPSQDKHRWRMSLALGSSQRQTEEAEPCCAQPRPARATRSGKQWDEDLFSKVPFPALQQSVPTGHGAGSSL